jgi:hypothetical protein
MAHDRRQVLRAAVVAVLLPLAGTPAIARAQDRAFAPPRGPMLYTRRLERSLPGGAHFTVSRSFAIRFREEEEGGYRVDGEQVAVEVDAPESLASFAEMERNRREGSLFPLLLDREGLIAADLEAEEPPRLDEAVQEALQRIARLHAPPADEAELTGFLRAVHANAALLLTALPRDLFAPGEDGGSQSRTLALPGGGEGIVTVAFDAETEPLTGLMRSARRQIITEFDGSLRRTMESWTLVPQS